MRISKINITCCLTAILLQTAAVAQTYTWQDINRLAPRTVDREKLVDTIPAGTGCIPDIAVTPLSGSVADSVGLVPASVTGLPVSIWQNSRVSDISQLLNTLPTPKHAPIQSILYNLLLAEADAPISESNGPSFLAIRIQKLIDLGSIQPALALMERAAPMPASLVPLLFDVSLYDPLLQPSCDQVLALGSKYTDDAARIYCMARKGDWMTAVLILQTAGALGTMSPREIALLHKFLETDSEDALMASLPPPTHVTPLEFRLYEAIGDALPTDLLPRAFAATDLSGDNGWRAQLNAAERLAETGAISENEFLGIFTLKPPAASGGVWDRVQAFQKLDRALSRGETTEIGVGLDAVWTNFGKTSMAPIIGNIFAERILSAPLDAQDQVLAAKLVMRSRYYEQGIRLLEGQDAFLAALARGDMSGAQPSTQTEQAIYDAFSAPRIPMAITGLLSQGKLGEVILTALSQFENGAQGDVQDLLESLSTLRHIGLEDVARRSAISVYLTQG